MHNKILSYNVLCYSDVYRLCLKYYSSIHLLLLLKNCCPLVGCSELDLTSFNINSSMFSQAPRTEILLPCGINGEEFVSIICQDNGQWLPDPKFPNTLLCSSDELLFCMLNLNVCMVIVPLDFTTTRNELQGPQSPSETIAVTDTSPSQTFLIPVFALAGTVTIIIVLCTSVVVAVACIWRATLSKREGVVSSGGDNCVYDEIVEPVYEKIEYTKEPVTVNTMVMSVTENEAYKRIAYKETNFTTMEVDVKVNDAYCLLESSQIIAENNKSYQTSAPLSVPIVQKPKDVDDTQSQCDDSHGSHEPENTKCLHKQSGTNTSQQLGSNSQTKAVSTHCHGKFKSIVSVAESDDMSLSDSLTVIAQSMQRN